MLHRCSELASMGMNERTTQSKAHGSTYSLRKNDWRRKSYFYEAHMGAEGADKVIHPYAPGLGNM
jgi:hypothetical protein